MALLHGGARERSTSRQQLAMKTWAAVVVASLFAVAVGQPPMVLKLERRASTEQLVAMDEQRHARLGGGAVQLPVSGSGDDYLAGGLYLTRVNLGNPPRSFNVLLDTGSSPSWVTCQTVAGSNAQPGLFDPRLSSTSSVFACSERRCQDIVRDSSGVCNTSSNSCGYIMNYGPGSKVLSKTTGYFLSDMVYLDILNGSQQTSFYPVPIIFGCTDSKTGELEHETFDGIFGDYYLLNLESIHVNGQNLRIDPSVFTPSAGYRTFVDSGTSLAHLADEAYDMFVSAIAAAVSPSANPTVGSGDQHCFVPSSSIDSSFPRVTLNFVGGAAMHLKPENYLRSRDNSIYCIAWQRSGQRVTILGDIVLADKLLVHDMENMLLGWQDFNCSQPFHVTTSPEKKNVNSAHASQKISMPTAIILIAFSFIFRP